MELIREMLAVLAVIALLALTLWWLRRKGLVQMAAGIGRPKPAMRHLESIERLALAPNHALHLIRIADRVVLVGRSPSGLTLLDSFEWRREERILHGARDRDPTPELAKGTTI